MTLDEADFISDAAALADTGFFLTMGEFHAVLRMLWPRGAGAWLTDDVWHCLDARRSTAAAKHAKRRKVLVA